MGSSVGANSFQRSAISFWYFYEFLDDCIKNRIKHNSLNTVGVVLSLSKQMEWFLKIDQNGEMQ